MEIMGPEGLVCQAEVADTFFSRALGLMFRGSMPKDEGLLIEYSTFFKSNTVTGWFMRFSLDLVFIDADKKVVDQHVLKPWTNYTPNHECRWVLELNVGVARGLVKVGDTLDF